MTFSTTKNESLVEERPGSGNIESYNSQLAQLNRLTHEIGWEKALSQVYGDQFGQYFSPDRAKFLNLLPLDDSDVLEIGPGFGQFTGEIASRARSVTALEVDEGQAEFLALKMHQQGIANVTVLAGGADCRLPYPDQAFDVIVLNLVFEWCGIRAEGSHYDAQMTLLAEMNRVLRRGGKLYIATKNRFAIRYIIGKPDEHMKQMRFGSALPRWLSRRLQKGRPDGMLYSYKELKRMIEGRGFIISQSWWATPDMRYTDKFIPCENSAIRRARKSGLQQGGSRSERIIMSLIPASLVKYFAPGLNFLAEKI